MSTFLYELPTTGAISFADVCIDHTVDHIYTPRIAQTTQSRANLRGALKETKRTDGEKDYLRIVKVGMDVGSVAHSDWIQDTGRVYTPVAVALAVCRP